MVFCFIGQMNFELWPPKLSEKVSSPEISAETHPEDIVDKQPPEEDAAGADVVQVEQLHSIEGKRQPKQIIGYPVLRCHTTKTTISDVCSAVAS